MKRAYSTFRRWLIPVVLIGAATLLAVPWSWWVIKQAYERDIIDNAQTLARRLELQLLASNVYASENPYRALQQALDVLKTELDADPTVQTTMFFDLRIPGKPVGWTRLRQLHDPHFDINEVRRRAKSPMLIDQLGEDYRITLPWLYDNQPLGVTYLEFSRTALSEQFWEKEGSLVRHVIIETTAAILILSLISIYAYDARLKFSTVRQQAEMSRLGYVAERGLTAAVLAHEIRNPLAALRFQLHSLRKNAADTDRVTGMADTIDGELSRIQQLVTDYLEHEKASSMRVANVDLEESVNGLRMIMAELLKDSQTELIVIPPPAPVIVVCDPHALRQVLMNLVLNAQQAMGRAGTVTIHISRDANLGTIDLTDTGPGISPEMREHLFKPFVTGKKDGHGIGLALAKRFVDNFAGNLSVDSEPGQATTFHLRLPLAKPGSLQSREA